MDVSDPQIIEAFVEARLTTLHEQAMVLVDEYWAHNTSAQKTRPINEWGKYGVRARRRGLAISIDWSRIHFYGPKGNRKPRSVYLPRGASHHYSKSAFREGPEWEQAVIAELETTFAAIRQETAALKALMQAHQSYMKARVTET